jgi:hypothetical protein
MTNIKYFYLIFRTLGLLFLGLFVLSMTAEIWLPPSLTRVLVVIAFGATATIFVTATGTGIFGMLAIAWMQSKTSRHILEIPWMSDVRHYALIRSDNKSMWVELGKAASASALSPSVDRHSQRDSTFLRRPRRQRAAIILPTPGHNAELWLAYHNKLGGNGNERSRPNH